MNLFSSPSNEHMNIVYCSLGVASVSSFCCKESSQRVELTACLPLVLTLKRVQCYLLSPLSAYFQKMKVGLFYHGIVLEHSGSFTVYICRKHFLNFGAVCVHQA
jgi:hypothetical protein